jgi:UDP-N-acetylglucosamine 2-epimerase (non-hydrolysing)
MGTRPEIIKMAPVVGALKRRGVEMLMVHSGQHYDFNLNQQFIAELRLPRPDYSIRLGSEDVCQVGELVTKLGKLLKSIEPACVLVEGDTNTVLAAGLAANKVGITLGHIEAGLRSFDLRMSEEHNRRLVDHISSYLFAPTKNARHNLCLEHVWGKIVVTGNTVIDACEQHLSLALSKSRVLRRIRDRPYALATIHRAENVDDPKVLGNFVSAFGDSPMRIVLPLHPRTRKRLRQFGLLGKLQDSSNVDVIDPVGYFDFLALMHESELILTDSGGIQEEVTAPSLRKRVLVLRRSTERPEAVKAGFARVVGSGRTAILRALSRESLARWKPGNRCPYGDGNAGERIVRYLVQEIES